MARFAIMQEPGAKALRSSYWSTPRPRRQALVQARTPKEALTRYVEQRYPKGHKQFAGSVLMWRSGWHTKKLHLDDGSDNPKRQWVLEVALQNGRRAHHTIHLYAWRQG